MDPYPTATKPSSSGREPGPMIATKRRMTMCGRMPLFGLIIFLFVSSHLAAHSLLSVKVEQAIRVLQVHSSYPKCGVLGDATPPCNFNDTLYICTSVPNSKVENQEQPSPHSMCLDSRTSWGACANGEWLCRCDAGHSLFGAVSWLKFCPENRAKRQLPSRADFSGRGYRLGNLIDRWFSFRVNMNTPLGKTFEDGIFQILGSAPRNSFGRYLFESRTQPFTSTAANVNRSSLRSTPYEDSFMDYFIYEYEALSSVLRPLRIAMREAIDGYVASTGFKIPEILPGTVVVHYRLGDMLSVGVLEPVRMAEALHTWSLEEGLRNHILRFEVLAAGIMWENLKEITVSEGILQEFVSALRALFPRTSITIEREGTPDDDWFKMVNAPMLFTSHGSYAISAAAINSGFRATPAVQNTNFPDCESSRPGVFQESWFLYGCKNLLSSFQRKIFPPSQNASSCVLGNATFSCCRVESWTVNSKRHPSPHPSCLGGKYSWGFCSQGEFLCKFPSVHPSFAVCTVKK